MWNQGKGQEHNQSLRLTIPPSQRQEEYLRDRGVEARAWQRLDEDWVHISGRQHWISRFLILNSFPQTIFREESLQKFQIQITLIFFAKQYESKNYNLMCPPALLSYSMKDMTSRLVSFLTPLYSTRQWNVLTPSSQSGGEWPWWISGGFYPVLLFYRLAMSDYILVS